MTPEAQRIAMAKLERLTVYNAGPNYFLLAENGAIVSPNYGSLDDIQRVFRGLTKEQKDDCMERVTMSLDAGKICVPWAFEATPAQWCEAILKSVGAWHD